MRSAEIHTGTELPTPVPRPAVLLAASVPLVALAQALGDALRFSDEFLTTIWPPLGVLVALLWLAPARSWLGWPSLVASFIAVEALVSFGLTRSLDALSSAFLLPSVSALGAVVVVWLLRRRGIAWPDFGRVGHVAEFLVIATLTGPVLAGLLGGWSAVALDSSRSLFGEALKFWCGDVLGILVVTPLMASWLCRDPEATPLWERKGELAALALAVVAAALVANGLPRWEVGSWVEVSHIVLPVLVWACLRFDVRIVSLLLAVAGGLVVRSAMARGGVESLVALQTYLLVGTSTMLLLSAAIVSGNRLRRRGLEVSAQKLEAERRLWRAQRNEDLGRLAAGVVHDFNNLLMVVRANALLAQRSRPGDAEYKSALDGIQEAVDRGAEDLKRLLVFGRGRTEDGPPRRIDLAGVLRRTGDLLRPALPSWIHLEIVIQSEPLWLDGIETMLEQALVHLGLNARDQITRADPGRRGVITFEAGAEVGGERPLLLQVRYEAVGPTSGAAAGATARTTWSGANPGVAMVTDVVRRHGGVIDAAPHPQGGTVVHLRFPAARREAVAG